MQGQVDPNELFGEFIATYVVIGFIIFISFRLIRKLRRNNREVTKKLPTAKTVPQNVQSQPQVELKPGTIVTRDWHSSKHKTVDGFSSSTKDYVYTKREYLMTSRERKFYRRLFDVFGKFYFIYPQLHFSVLLDHRMKSQNWQGALSRIQRKSVDYVLCTTDFKIVAAIELDDKTHDSLERQQRDAFIDSICAQAGLPLVRFRNIESITDEQIKNNILLAIKSSRKNY